jgi:hypothetical protein
MRWAQTAVVTVLLAGSAAWADKVVTADQTYDNVKVLDFSAGEVQIFVGKGVRKIPLGDVKQLTLNGETLLNQAEELRAQGNVQEAFATYSQAREKAMKGQWHQMLVKTRLDEMKKLGGGVAGKPGPVKNKPPDVKKDTSDVKADPLSSLDALGADLATEPMAPKDRDTWKGLDEQQQKEATAKYQTELAEWKKKHTYKGLKVSWVMKVEEIKAGSEGVSTVMCKSAKGYVLSADVAAIDEPVRKAIAAKKPVAIIGAIADCNVDLNRSDSIFNSDMMRLGVALDDAQVYLPDKAPKLTTTQATSQPASAPARK